VRWSHVPHLGDETHQALQPLVANRLDSEADSQDDGQGGKFPSLFLCKEGASCCLMYLHGNAEDLGLSHDLLKAFR
jgi:hypothetical protein